MVICGQCIWKNKIIKLLFIIILHFTRQLTLVLTPLNKYLKLTQAELMELRMIKGIPSQFSKWEIFKIVDRDGIFTYYFILHLYIFYMHITVTFFEKFIISQFLAFHNIIISEHVPFLPPQFYCDNRTS